MNEELLLNVKQTVVAFKNYVLQGKCPFMRQDDLVEMIVILEEASGKIERGIILNEEDLEDFIEAYLT